MRGQPVGRLIAEQPVHQPRLTDAVRPGEGHPGGAGDGELLLAITELGQPASGRHLRIGQVDPHHFLPPQPGIGLRQPRLGLVHPVVEASPQRTSIGLGAAPTFIGSRPDEAGVGHIATSLACAARQPGLGVAPLPLLTAHLLGGGGHRLRGRRLLGVHLVAIGLVGAAEHPQPAGVEFSQVVQAFKQFEIMTDHHQRPRPVDQDVVEQPPGVGVQVVGGFVEQSDLGTGQPQPGQRGQNHLAAGQGAHRPVQVEGTQAHL